MKQPAPVSSPTSEPHRAYLVQLRHELRTPLNAVLGFSEMLQEEAAGNAPAELLQGFGQVQQCGQRLLAIINHALDAVQRNENEPFEFKKLATPLRQALLPLVEQLQEQNLILTQQCMALGQEAFLPDLKGIAGAITSLHTLLKELATPKPPMQTLVVAAAAPEVESKPAPCHLLVVDDNAAIRGIFARQLNREGHQVSTAANGAQALALLREHTFDIVLLDVVMPQMNGYQVLEQMKAHPDWCDIPVIMISALDQLDSVVRCLELGAEDCLSKPFNSILLRVRVNSCLEKKRLRDQLREQLKTIQNELDIAAGIQQSILPNEFPAFPDVPELELFAAMIPAREVGGDFYDFFLIDKDRVGLVIGDVSGKGVPAALFMAVTRTLVKSIALTGKAPGECLQQVNRLLVAENRSFMFVTLFYAILNFRTGELTFSNAGHNPPYRLSRQGKVETFGAQGGIVLGVTEELDYPTDRLQLQPGDQLFFYTDGISEAYDNDEEIFSDERLQQCLQQAVATAPEALIQAVVTEVRAFSGSAPQSDDLTMLAVSYRG
ncbi:MAG TPA: SpoIIE family protein phosphatase [Blastocatellia bacterium]|nr:SpoIIE family protein phosphatase [Blastocatellia bacterium]